MSAPAIPTPRVTRPGRLSGIFASRYLRLWSARIGLALTLTIVLIAIVGPMVAPHDPALTVGLPFASPDRQFPFGLDFLGRDVFSRWLYGGRSVIILALLSTVLGQTIGVLVGLTAAYKRNWVDVILMRFSDAVFSFPQIILVLVFVTAVGPKLWLVVCAVALTLVPRVARLTRGLAVEHVAADYVEAAVARGEGTRWILTNEIFPNIMPLLIIDFGLRLSSTVMIIAAVGFLGFGLQPPHADWGLMINENRGALVTQPWAIVWPAIAIAILTVGINLMADAAARASARFEEETAG
jgi:peptide/nickel transport system permease protein